jgi:glucose/arabinose dehydrogenase
MQCFGRRREKMAGSSAFNKRFTRGSVLALFAVGTMGVPSAAQEEPDPAPTLVFEDTLVAKVPIPTDVDWTPDGRLLITSMSGELWVQSPGRPRRLALDLRSVTCSAGDSGLLSLAVHPRFEKSGFVYVYYTFERFGPCDTPRRTMTKVEDGPEPASPVVERVSRFVLGRDDRVDPSSEEVVLETPPTTAYMHHGGDIHFGHDGLLYIFIGDAQSTKDSQNSRAGDPTTLFGKALRITETGAIPADNPYRSALGGCAGRNGFPAPTLRTRQPCPEIYATGLRNPFRAAFDPSARGVRFYINDVGFETFEEINEGRAGANYGWPKREGPCPFGAKSAAGCQPASPGLTDPLFFYGRAQGGSITGGAFVPDGLWPGMNETYLFADLMAGLIYRLDPAPAGGFVSAPLVHAPLVTSLRFGPHEDGTALYYASVFENEIRRLDLVSSDAEGDEAGEAVPVAGGDAGD